MSQRYNKNSYQNSIRCKNHKKSKIEKYLLQKQKNATNFAPPFTTGAIWI